MDPRTVHFVPACDRVAFDMCAQPWTTAASCTARLLHPAVISEQTMHPRSSHARLLGARHPCTSMLHDLSPYNGTAERQSGTVLLTANVACGPFGWL